MSTIPRGYTFTVEDRYGAPFEQLKPPDGYDFTGEFRPSSDNEFWLMSHAVRVRRSSYCSVPNELPVLILRPRPKRKRIIFEETAGQCDWTRFRVYGESPDGLTMYRGSVGMRIPSKLYTRREEEF